jgi:hypothetical protein
MYDVRPHLVIGFHGCDADIQSKLLNNPNEIEISRKPYDWLGNGMYFWENNQARAMEWAEQKASRGEIKKPAVIGAILFLGLCCDFLDSKYTDLIGVYYSLMAKQYEELSKELPINKDLKNDKHKDQILRELDCATIEFMHQQIFAAHRAQVASQGFSTLPIFDSARGAFGEGGPAFDGAGISRRSHIQICIRNPNCIKGFFLPRNEIDFKTYLEGIQIVPTAAV